MNRSDIAFDGFGQFRIQGRIVQADTGLAVNGVLVRAFDVDVLTADDFLGEGNTGSNGEFQITYCEDDFVKNDLLVKSHAILVCSLLVSNAKNINTSRMRRIVSSIARCRYTRYYDQVRLECAKNRW